MYRPFATAMIAASLAACATSPDLRGLRDLDEPLHAELDVPFHAATVAPGGAESLAMVFGAAGVRAPVEALGAATDDEMLAVPRRHGLVSYPTGGSLTALLMEIDAGHPVIVRRTRPTPSYRVVVGYDLERRQLIVHGPDARGVREPIGWFDRDWARAGRWAMVALAPDDAPASIGPRTGLAAIDDYERVVGVADAASAWVAATAAWPDQPFAWYARGIAHRERLEFDDARDAFMFAVRLEPALEPAWLALGKLFESVGERDNALAALQVVLALNGPWQAEAQAVFERLTEQSPVI